MDKKAVRNTINTIWIKFRNAFYNCAITGAASSLYNMAKNKIKK